MARQRNRKGRSGLVAGAVVAALLVMPATASADVDSEFNGGVLTVNSTANDGIAITSVGGLVKVNGNDPDGAVDSADVTSIDVSGGPGANNINLAGVNGTDFTTLTSVTVDAGDGNDTINGTQLADELEGGNGDDRIIGDNNPAGSHDESRGESGNDTMVWNPGDGDDINEGADGSDTVEVNGGGKEQFEVTPGRFARVQPDPTFGAPFTVDFSTSEKLDLNAGAADDIVNMAGGALGLAIDVDGGEGNDTIDGSDAPDLLAGGNGNDRLIGDNNAAGTRDVSRGDAGNDTLVWNPGDGDDVNEGGEGSDVIEVNGGGGGEVFEFKASAIPGRAAFDRTGPNPPGPFNLDIGTAERLDLNANGGDDSLNAAGVAGGLAGWTIDAEGGDGNDNLAGASLAVDLLSGGAGADTLRSRDQSADTLTGGSEVDSAVVDAQDIVNADVEIVDRGQGSPAPAARRRHGRPGGEGVQEGRAGEPQPHRQGSPDRAGERGRQGDREASPQGQAARQQDDQPRRG